MAKKEVTPYLKQSEGWSWQQEYDNIQLQVQDHINTLSILLNQVADRKARIENCQMLIALLDDSRKNKAEKDRLIRLITSLNDGLPMIEKQAVRVEARLKDWKAREESYPVSELQKERRIAQARQKVGIQPAAGGSSYDEHWSGVRP